MNSSLSLALLSLPLVWLAPRGDEVTFHVRSGTKLTKTFEEKLELSLDSMKLVSDGEEVPHDEMGEFDMKVESSTTVVFTDHYKEVDGDRPKVLARSFDSLSSKEKQSMSSDGESQDENRDESSELEGKTVVFTWMPDESRYDAQFDGDGGDTALLADLAEDSDLRAFLPGKAVSEGDTWTIDAEAFDSIFNPGGDVRLQSDEDEEDSHERAAQFRKNFEGKIGATYKGSRDEEGVKVAVIHLALEIDTHSSSEHSEDGVNSNERFELGWQLEGDLLWDLGAGRAHSMAIEGDVKLEITNAVDGDYDGESFSFSQTMALAGRTSFAGTWKAAE